jgi:hypothetical protein
VEHEKNTFFSLLENTRSGAVSQGRPKGAAPAVGAKRRAFTDDGAEGTRVSAKKPDSPRLSTNNDDESRFFLIKPHRPCAAKE